MEMYPNSKFKENSLDDKSSLSNNNTIKLRNDKFGNEIKTKWMEHRIEFSEKQCV